MCATSPPAARSRLPGALLAVAGLALLVWQVNLVGLDEIVRGFLAVHVTGFLAILALSLFRFTARSLAWTILIDGRVPLRSATAATISGDALGNLSFLSLLVSEPAKAIYVTRHVTTDEALGALTAENFFYSVSVAVVVVAGTATLLATFVLPDAWRAAALMSLALMAGVLAGALWLAWKRPGVTSTTRAWLVRNPDGRLGHLLARLRDVEHIAYRSFRAAPWRLGVVIACEVAFHAASVAEAWLTVWLLTGTTSLLHAFLLDTVNRVINVVFRAVPLRVGVDEVTTSGFAELIGLGSAAGVTMALVRKARLLAWAGVGLALLGRRAWRAR